jgi:hypothetical protein
LRPGRFERRISQGRYAIREVPELIEALLLSLFSLCLMVAIQAAPVGLTPKGSGHMVLCNHPRETEIAAE